ncbi:hypothetical protein fugu_015515 [Takifugu bimaculatus]|uniref:RGS domain-containing protein n=1 Tax=Takifugu bimaculatus TaxID=433685 RepID=A0A4Z2BYX5_9TELE|nr:hypothetical protein fugu_015515 [Takifugu bimaculatus]
MDLKDTKTQRVAKAIYKRYIENSGVVARQLKPATKTFIRDNIKKQHIDSAMFDQAQTEIQADMEENAYQMFLTSDVYLEYVRTGGENPNHVNPNGLGDLKAVCGYLPTLNEEEEWSCDFKAKALAVGLSAKTLKAPGSIREMEVLEQSYRSYARGDAFAACRVGSLAPVSSTNDSEANAKANANAKAPPLVSSASFRLLCWSQNLKGLISGALRVRSALRNPLCSGTQQQPADAGPSSRHELRTRRPPKEMVPMKPAEFAAQLISRLESLKRKRDTISSLEERLQQIQEEEEREDADVVPSVPLLSPHPLTLLPWLIRRRPPGHPGRSPLAGSEDPGVPVPCGHLPLAPLQLPRAEVLRSARLWVQVSGEDGAVQLLRVQF